MRMFQDLTAFRQLAEQVSRPNCSTSFLQLARRAKLTDDTARRSLERLKCEFNDPLLVIRDRHAALTDAGRELLQLSVRLSALAESTEMPPDVLTVEADSLLAALLVTSALPAVLEIWGSMVQPKICRLMEDVRRNVQEGITSFGAGFDDGGNAVCDEEVLGPKVPWVLVMPKNHRLANVTDPVIAENLTLNDRVFIPEMATEWPGMDRILKAVPAFNRIICDATLGIRLALSGLGAAVVPDLLLEDSCVSKRVIAGVESAQPRFFLPRKGMDALAEPAQLMVEQIRKVAESRRKQETLPEQPAVEFVEAALLEEPNRQLEGALS